MSTNNLFILVMVLGGALLAFQGPINAALGKTIGPYEAALISFVVGTLVAVLVVLVAGKGNLRGVANVPWWQLVGGVLGIIYIILIILSVPRLGVTVMMVAVLLGQLTAAMAIDHFGWFGVPVRPFGWHRMLALPMLFGAVWLMNYTPKK